MSNNISGFGTRVVLIASETFPAGIEISQFADDADPIDFPNLTVADKAMGLNGDLVSWNSANPIETTLNVIPGSEDDVNLGILLEANRAGRGKASVQDNITLTRILPDGTQKTLTNGIITEGMPANSVSSAGRQKSKPYMFAFENISS